jgi:hypothetical protein
MIEVEDTIVAVTSEGGLEGAAELGNNQRECAS